jgi:hypothetical protein
VVDIALLCLKWHQKLVNWYIGEWYIGILGIGRSEETASGDM